jgi:hypothetical protein
VKFVSLLLLGPWTLDGFVVIWEPPIYCGVGPNLVVIGPVSAVRKSLSGTVSFAFVVLLTPENRVRPLWSWLGLCGVG